ncbi:uncharacterized protein Z519_03668 [Cladophialophora bantiana CBS 173.52]|uniref:RNA 3'-terminal phosphate cyclase domain-containing protein n=1 Tax=Cladophialophora bantiana (strain ATCC 10958 / CBS 173.52 / CDC B-1940 / NIH 8579) TaxID=1442370 RepID=A0A0D2HVW4_CLAB1|nr:uncharacterized protein Z519_03668 [Cladophialophora bantiana CBS 173.52]KIW95085.1 hypothetical protein Z519_03668 [Cladophialophora bantiana CBS 173.52]
MLALDGSTLEGGGQLVRVALSLSAICEVPIRIYNIRAGRGANLFYKQTNNGRGNRNGHGNRGISSPSARATGGTAATAATAKHGPGGGLKESHLAALRWLALECGAEVEGAEASSQDLMFKPARLKYGNRDARRNKTERNESGEPEVIELKNPGSVWLIWQAIFPYIVFSMLRRRRERPETPAFRIRLRGGTNVPKSPSSEYMQQVLLPLCERIGLPKVDIQVLRRGWTTGVLEIGEVEISVFHPRQFPEDDNARRKSEADRRSEKQKGRADGKEDEESKGFALPSFHIASPGPITITSVSMTILAGSPKTHSLAELNLVNALRKIPPFSSPSIPVQLHPSSADSGDERRLYILLVARTSAGYALGRDYLSPGRKVTNETERHRMVEEAVGHVVRSFTRECVRGSCLDEFAEDQLVIFQALADGASSVDVGRSGKNKEKGEDSGSLHTRTVRWVCREMLGTVFDGLGGCEGRGLCREEGGVDMVREGVEVLNIDEDEEE